MRVQQAGSEPGTFWILGHCIAYAATQVKEAIIYHGDILRVPCLPALNCLLQLGESYDELN